MFAPISDTQVLEYLVDKNRHGNLAWFYYQLIDNKLRLANSLSVSYLPKFSRFVCQDTSTNCLQLIGCLPEQSKAKVRIISNKRDFRLFFFIKTVKIRQNQSKKLSALTFASSTHYSSKKSCIFAIGLFPK